MLGMTGFNLLFIWNAGAWGSARKSAGMSIFLEYRYRLAMAMEAESRRTRSKARKAPVVEGEAAICYRRIFFTCAEVESFP